MDNEPGKADEDRDATVAEGLGPWLREARKDRSLTTAAVAQALHLDTQIVDALETEAFESLGATVFAKGHVRAVASYLGLDTEEAARRFHSASGTPANSQPDLIVQYHSRPPTDRRWVFGALIALLLIVIAGLAWVTWSLVRSQSASADQPAAELVVEPTPEASVTPGAASDSFATRLEQARVEESAQPGANPARDSIDANQGQTIVSEPAPSRVDAGAVASATAGDVVLEFSESCWYEVRDANGGRIAYGTAEPGLTRSINGTRPLSLVIGVADAVNVRVDGEAFPITPAMRRGRTARFSIP